MGLSAVIETQGQIWQIVTVHGPTERVLPADHDVFRNLDIPQHPAAQRTVVGGDCNSVADSRLDRNKKSAEVTYLEAEFVNAWGLTDAFRLRNPTEHGYTFTRHG